MHVSIGATNGYTWVRGQRSRAGRSLEGIITRGARVREFGAARGVAVLSNGTREYGMIYVRV